jgi:hypothetical protein
MNAAAYSNNDGPISSIDSFVVGLAPTFWAHVPLLIEHVQSHLHVIDGIQCFILNEKHLDEMDGFSLFSTQLLASSFPEVQKIIPTSKCHLVGTIVYAERKANGCNIYILDDGTGLIDILHYSDGDLYSLPSLSGHQDNNMGCNILEPGDLVRIFGRIQCKVVKLSPGLNTVTTGSTAHGHKMKQFIPASSVTREIHASVIIPLATASINHSRARPSCIDEECEHWMNCIKFLRTRSMENGSIASDLPLLNNAMDVLPLLGSDLVNQIIERNSVCSSLAIHNTFDDVTQAWRLFGTQCQCTNIALKRDLLYCHCTAIRQENPTVDPNFVYRDALLTKLLEDEAEFASNLPRPKSVNDIWNDIINEVEDDQSCYHFHFQYSAIAANDKLNRIASEEISKMSSNNVSTSNESGNDGNINKSNPIVCTNVQELIRGTVRALRKDGILHLINADTDTYLLVSRTGVLEPYVRTKLALQKLSTERRTQYYEGSSRFPYIKSVPRSRLEFVRRCLSAANAYD